MTPLQLLKSNRDFRLLWLGLATSLVGDGIWLVAVAWQVIELDGGPLALSVVTTAFAAGLVGLILIGGVVADRLPRRQIMITVDALLASVVVIVGLMALNGVLEIWQLTLASLLLGIGGAFYVPAFTALVPQIVRDEDLLAANGLDGILRPTAEAAIGPLLAGAIVAAASPGAAILLNGFTFAFSAGCVMRVRVRLAAKSEPESPVKQLKEGLNHVRANRWLWSTLLFAMVAVLFIVGPIDVLLPFAIKENIGGGASEYGIAVGCYGVAAALGALLISSRPLPRRYLSVMLLCWGVGAVPMAVIGFTSQVWVVYTALLVVGLGDGIGLVIWGTMLQTRVPNELQGRVASLDWFVSLGLLPLSMAIAGPAGELIGLKATFIVAGVGPVIAAFLVLFGLKMYRDEIRNPLPSAK